MSPDAHALQTAMKKRSVALPKFLAAIMDRLQARKYRSVSVPGTSRSHLSFLNTSKWTPTPSQCFSGWPERHSGAPTSPQACRTYPEHHRVIALAGNERPQLFGRERRVGASNANRECGTSRFARYGSHGCPAASCRVIFRDVEIEQTSSFVQKFCTRCTTSGKIIFERTQRLRLLHVMRLLHGPLVQ